MEPRVYPHHTPAEREGIRSHYRLPDRRPNRYGLHLVLFLLTFASTVLSGGQFAGRLLAYEGSPVVFMLGGFPVTAGLLLDGLRFACSFLLFLTVHEFGHYFAARRHGVAVSLPYYIPTPFIGFGTMGAVIRIRDPIPSLRKLFDIGAAGPIAGFVVAVTVLLVALFTLPPPSYIFGLEGHELLKTYVQQHGRFPSEMPPPTSGEAGFVIILGPTLLFTIFSAIFPNVPPLYELYHYPILFAGWLGLFFTALNLLPVGQLDGGHILYALLGRKWHTRLARAFVVLILLSGAIGVMYEPSQYFIELRQSLGPFSWFALAAILYLFLRSVFQSDHRWIAPVLLGMMLLTALAGIIGEPLTQIGYSGWFVFCLLIVWLIKVDHPPVFDARPLTPGRRVLGVVCVVIFILCFSLRPFYII